MTTFTKFLDELPTPNVKINQAGASDTNGSAGPGFMDVNFTSLNQGVQAERTRSGRGVTGSSGFSHVWSFNINYNRLTRAEFEPVSTFLESRYGRLKHFYVTLPQYSAPQNPALLNNTITVAKAELSGSPTLLVTGVENGEIKAGDFFNINDPSDSNHKKAYKVLRVETPTTYQLGTTAPIGSQRRIWTQPPLNRTTSIGAAVVFDKPKFRVIKTSDVHEYKLAEASLYEFSLSVEEFLP